MTKNNLIKDKSYRFAVSIIRFYKSLIKEKEYVLGRQLLRCGTSIGANIEEAIGGQSKKDFIAKMSIAYKEARETNYWIRLLGDTSIVDRNQLSGLQNESEELLRILTSILRTARLR